MEGAGSEVVQEDSGVAQGATVDEVEQVVSDAVTDVNGHVDVRSDAVVSQLDGIEQTLSVRLQGIDDGIDSLTSQVESSTPEDGHVYMVRVDSGQVQAARDCLSILCTECLLLLVVMAVNAGLLGWRAFTARWL